MRRSLSFSVGAPKLINRPTDKLKRREKVVSRVDVRAGNLVQRLGRSHNARRVLRASACRRTVAPPSNEIPLCSRRAALDDRGRRLYTAPPCVSDSRIDFGSMGEFFARSPLGAGVPPLRAVLSSLWSPLTMSPPDRSSALEAAHPARAGFAIVAAAEPGILARLIGAFAQRSLVPARWHGSLTPAGEIELDIRFDDLDATQVERIAAKLRSLIGVRAVLTWQDSES